MGVRLEVDMNVPVLQTDWDASAFVDAHTLGTAVDERAVILNAGMAVPAAGGEDDGAGAPAEGG
eukprot:2958752-Alexandrium_andersonii.AAC.1